MKKVTKKEFFTLLNEFNFTGKSQTKDVMPSKTSIKFKGRFAETDWICQKTRKLFGKTISDGYGIERTQYLVK
jgi:hypothetical protein